MIFELQIYGKVSLDVRFHERLRKEKLSEHCIYCIARMPDGKIVLDANKRATIVDDTTFEVITQLDPNDSQLICIGFQKDKMLTHYHSMYNISYQPFGKYYQLANTDTNNWQYCMCVPDDHHIV